MLRREGYTVVTCADGQAALKMLPSQDFAAALIDLGLESVQGRHVVEAVRAAKPALPIVVMSGVLLAEADDHLPGLPAGLDGLYRLPKPFRPQNLMALVTAITSSQANRTGRPHIAEAAGGSSS
jgi:DNA-binding response OmpR family regulator